jgi:hypothetical protein
MDLNKDLEDIILDGFRIRGVQVNYTGIHELLIKYFNFISKTITSTNWDVLYSTELQSKTLPRPYNLILKDIEEKFQNSGDINPYLSKDAFNPDKPDFLLYDWDIRHLHLSDSKDNPSDYFYSRSKNLLFFFLSAGNGYFIDVLPHQLKANDNAPNLVWVEKNLLRIIKNNWPHLLNPFKISKEENDKLSDEDRYDLRRTGIVTNVVIDGMSYLPMGGGITTAKTGGNFTIWSDQLFLGIKRFEEDLQNNPSKYIELIKKQGFESPANLDFKLIEQNRNLLVLEKNSRVAFPSGFHI